MANDAEANEALAWVMNEGHFDDIRKKVMESLRQNESLKAYTMQQLDDSETLAGTDLATANRKKVLEGLRKELEDKLLDYASREAWSAMSDPDDPICRLIEEKVHEALCVLYEKRHQQTSTQAHQHQHQHFQQQQQHQHPAHGHPAAYSWAAQPGTGGPRF